MVYILWMSMLMVSHIVCFAEKGIKFFLAEMILDFELFLGFTIQKQKITHFYCSQALMIDGVVDDANCHDAVNLNRGGLC